MVVKSNLTQAIFMPRCLHRGINLIIANGNICAFSYVNNSKHLPDAISILFLTFSPFNASIYFQKTKQAFKWEWKKHVWKNEWNNSQDVHFWIWKMLFLLCNDEPDKNYLQVKDVCLPPQHVNTSIRQYFSF